MRAVTNFGSGSSVTVNWNVWLHFEQRGVKRPARGVLTVSEWLQ
jgi:hypothetical protein